MAYDEAYDNGCICGMDPLAWWLRHGGKFASGYTVILRDVTKRTRWPVAAVMDDFGNLFPVGWA